MSDIIKGLIAEILCLLLPKTISIDVIHVIADIVSMSLVAGGALGIAISLPTLSSRFREFGSRIAENDIIFNDLLREHNCSLEERNDFINRMFYDIDYETISMISNSESRLYWGRNLDSILLLLSQVVVLVYVLKLLRNYINITRINRFRSNLLVDNDLTDRTIDGFVTTTDRMSSVGSFMSTISTGSVTDFYEAGRNLIQSYNLRPLERINAFRRFYREQPFISNSTLYARYRSLQIHRSLFLVYMHNRSNFQFEFIVRRFRSFMSRFWRP